jgi:hypothetical protein
MKRVTVTEFVRGFSDFINRVVYQGERFVLVRGGRELAEVRPRRTGRQLAELAELLEGLPRLSPEEATAFGADLDAARASLGAELPDTGWQS